MEWARTWDWASAVVIMPDGSLQFRSGLYGLTTMRQVDPPAEECRARFLCVSDYWSTYR